MGGIFYTEDGHFQGWLDALLCCCAISQDESPYEKEREKERKRASAVPEVCKEQPRSLFELPASPVPSALLAAKREDDDLILPAPALNPPDLGSSSLESQRRRRRSSLGHSKLHRFDAAFDGQRQALVPLPLGPVVLRNSPAPPVKHSSKALPPHLRSDSTQALLPQDQPNSYREQRETPLERCRARSSIALAAKLADESAKTLKRSASAEGHGSLLHSASTTRSSSLLKRESSAGDAPSHLSRTVTDHSSLRRKGSFQIRKPFAESGDIDTDQEVLELNTIVKERRAKAARAQHLDQHVAAIAPSMQIQARSETLNAIGSALGRPLTAQANCETSTPPPTASPVRLRRSNSASSRVSGWLSHAFPSHSVAHLPTDEPFYKCQPQRPEMLRTRSDTSVRSSLTEMDSPTLTGASSLASKDHSRSQTGDSYTTPLSPEQFGEQYSEAKKSRATVKTPTTHVGVAL